MNIGSGWEQKSMEQKSPFIFIIRTENSRNDQTVGRKATLRLRTSFRKPQAVTLSLLAWRNRQQPARIGRWCMVSDKVDFLAGNCMGAMNSPACSCVSITFANFIVNANHSGVRPRPTHHSGVGECFLRRQSRGFWVEVP